MGGVPVKHHSKGKVGRRRSHLALKKKRLLVCAECKSPVVPHRACINCGTMPQAARDTKAKKPATART